MIKKVSASKLDSYAACPYQYYIKYVRNMFDHGIRSESMHFGTMIHEILKDFHAWVKSHSLPENENDLRQLIYNKVLTIIGQKIKVYQPLIKNRSLREYDIYKNHISIYLNYFMQEKLYIKNFDAEKEFDVSIDEIASTITNKHALSPLVEKYKDVSLVGKIDLIIYPDIVIDFKTQGKKSFSKSFVSNFQSIFYTLIYPRDMTFIYMFLWEKLETAEIKLSAETRTDKLNLIVNLIHVIDNTKHFNVKQSSCRMCIFKSICPHKKT